MIAGLCFEILNYKWPTILLLKISQKKYIYLSFNELIKPNTTRDHGKQFINPNVEGKSLEN